MEVNSVTNSSLLLLSDPKLIKYIEHLKDYLLSRPLISSSAVHVIYDLCDNMKYITLCSAFPRSVHKNTSNNSRTYSSLILHLIEQQPEHLETAFEYIQEQTIKWNKQYNILTHNNKLSCTLLQNIAKEKIKLNYIKEESQDKITRILSVLSVLYNKFNDIIHNIIMVVAELINCFSQQSLNLSKSLLFSYISFDLYFLRENQYTSELTVFARNTFFKSLAEMLSQQTLQQLDILNHEPIEQSLNSLVDVKSDILQVQSLKSHGILNHSRTSSELDFLQAGKECLVRWLNRTETGILYTDVEQLLNTLQSAGNMKNDIISEFNEESICIYHLVETLALNQMSSIISGDLNLKIIRQEYLLTKQQELRDSLQRQKNRYTLCSMLCQAEMEQSKIFIILLEHLNKYISQVSTLSTQRKSDTTKLITVQRLSEGAPKKLIIPSSNTLLIKLYKILEATELEKSSNFPAYETFNHSLKLLNVKIYYLYMQSKSLYSSNLLTALHSFPNVKRNYEKTKKLLNCSEYIFANGGRKSYLNKQIHIFEESLKEKLVVINEKKHELAENPNSQMERQLFVAFYKDASLFMQLYSKISNR